VIEINFSNVKLQQLRISAGWTITYNGFYQIDPNPDIKLLKAPNELTIWELFFSQDLFQAEHQASRLLIDIGWYPEGEPSGYYGLEIIRWEDKDSKGNREYLWSTPVFSTETRSRVELVNVIEDLLLTAPSRFEIN
jgi:hypothetical protein